MCLMIVYISQAEAKRKFGESEPAKLKGIKIPSPYGEPWRIKKARLLGNVNEDGSFEIRLDLD